MRSLSPLGPSPCSTGHELTLASLSQERLPRHLAGAQGARPERVLRPRPARACRPALRARCPGRHRDDPPARRQGRQVRPSFSPPSLFVFVSSSSRRKLTELVRVRRSAEPQSLLECESLARVVARLGHRNGFVKSSAKLQLSQTASHRGVKPYALVQPHFATLSPVLLSSPSTLSAALEVFHQSRESLLRITREHTLPGIILRDQRALLQQVAQASRVQVAEMLCDPPVASAILAHLYMQPDDLRNQGIKILMRECRGVVLARLLEAVNVPLVYKLALELGDEDVEVTAQAERALKAVERNRLGHSASDRLDTAHILKNAIVGLLSHMNRGLHEAGHQRPLRDKQKIIRSLDAITKMVGRAIAGFSPQVRPRLPSLRSAGFDKEALADAPPPRADHGDAPDGPRPARPAARHARRLSVVPPVAQVQRHRRLHRADDGRLRPALARAHAARARVGRRDDQLPRRRERRQPVAVRAGRRRPQRDRRARAGQPPPRSSAPALVVRRPPRAPPRPHRERERRRDAPGPARAQDAPRGQHGQGPDARRGRLVRPEHRSSRRGPPRRVGQGRPRERAPAQQRVRVHRHPRRRRPGPVRATAAPAAAHRPRELCQHGRGDRVCAAARPGPPRRRVPLDQRHQASGVPRLRHPGAPAVLRLHREPHPAAPRRRPGRRAGAAPVGPPAAHRHRGVRAPPQHALLARQPQAHARRDVPDLLVHVDVPRLDTHVCQRAPAARPGVDGAPSVRRLLGPAPPRGHGRRSAPPSAPPPQRPHLRLGGRPRQDQGRDGDGPYRPGLADARPLGEQQAPLGSGASLSLSSRSTSRISTQERRADARTASRSRRPSSRSWTT